MSVASMLFLARLWDLAPADPVTRGMWAVKSRNCNWTIGWFQTDTPLKINGWNIDVLMEVDGSDNFFLWKIGDL